MGIAMTTQTSTNQAFGPTPEPRNEKNASHIFVMVAMGLVAAAIGVGLKVQLGLAAGPAFAAATAVASILFALHALNLRYARTQALEAEIARLESEVGRTSVRMPAPSQRMPPIPRPLTERSTSQPAVQPEPAQQPARAPAGAASPDHHAAASAPVANRPFAASGGPGLSEFAARASTLDDRPSVSDTASALEDAWNFRPQHPPMERGNVPTSGTGQVLQPALSAGLSSRLVAAVDGVRADARLDFRPESRPESRPEARPESRNESLHSSLREADVEMIQSLIKKLADEVNATEASHQASPPARAEQTARPPAGHEGYAGAASTGPSALPRSVEASIDALRMTADAMGAAPRIPAHHRPQPTGLSRLIPPQVSAAPQPSPQTQMQPQSRDTGTGPQRPPTAPSTPAHSHVAAIAQALHAGRVDVLLEPIMGLGDLRARHYEVSIRLGGPAGEPVDADPHSRTLAGTGVLPLLDRARFARTANVAERLEERGKSGSVFSAFSGESLADKGFVAAAAESCRERASVGGQLVLSFAQSDVRMLSPGQWNALGDLRDLGFRFAISDVTHLDMDFERLAATGFTFVKLDADVFLDGMRAPYGLIPPGDICRHLAGLGLSPIVGRIDDDSERARLHNFGVVYGQGSLFGGARPVKADALARPHHAAA